MLVSSSGSLDSPDEGTANLSGSTEFEFFEYDINIFGEYILDPHLYSRSGESNLDTVTLEPQYEKTSIAAENLELSTENVEAWSSLPDVQSEHILSDADSDSEDTREQDVPVVVLPAPPLDTDRDSEDIGEKYTPVVVLAAQPLKVSGSNGSYEVLNNSVDNPYIHETDDFNEYDYYYDESPDLISSPLKFTGPIAEWMQNNFERYYLDLVKFCKANSTKIPNAQRFLVRFVLFLNLLIHFKMFHHFLVYYGQPTDAQRTDISF